MERATTSLVETKHRAMSKKVASRRKKRIRKKQSSDADNEPSITSLQDGLGVSDVLIHIYSFLDVRTDYPAMCVGCNDDREIMQQVDRRLLTTLRYDLNLSHILDTYGRERERATILLDDAFNNRDRRDYTRVPLPVPCDQTSKLSATCSLLGSSFYNLATVHYSYGTGLLFSCKGAVELDVENGHALSEDELDRTEEHGIDWIIPLSDESLDRGRKARAYTQLKLDMRVTYHKEAAEYYPDYDISVQEREISLGQYDEQGLPVPLSAEDMKTLITAERSWGKYITGHNTDLDVAEEGFELRGRNRYPMAEYIDSNVLSFVRPFYENRVKKLVKDREKNGASYKDARAVALALIYNARTAVKIHDHVLRKVEYERTRPPSWGDGLLVDPNMTRDEYVATQTRTAISCRSRIMDGCISRNRVATLRKYTAPSRSAVDFNRDLFVHLNDEHPSINLYLIDNRFWVYNVHGTFAPTRRFVEHAEGQGGVVMTDVLRILPQLRKPKQRCHVCKCKVRVSPEYVGNRIMCAKCRKR